MVCYVEYIKYYDVVIIDSGMDMYSSLHSKLKVEGLTISPNGDSYYVTKGTYQDTIGHGTAVVDALTKTLINKNIFIIKLFTIDTEITEYDIEFALQYVIQHIHCKVINLSLGIRSCANKDKLEKLCATLLAKGVIIVAAFDNMGSVSYPAAFDSVIGIDCSFNLYDLNSYEFIENSIVNIRGPIKQQRLLWLNNEKRMLNGNSFFAPRITAKILKLIEAGFNTKKSILAELKKGSIKTISYDIPKKLPVLFKIKKAIVFPFNKEIHSLARYENLLSFHVCGYYDTKYSGNLGYTMNKFFISNKKPIENIDDLSWDLDFDTVILGHTDSLTNILKKKYALEIIDNCLKYKKNLVCFDNVYINKQILQKFRNNGLNIFYPYVSIDMIPHGQITKLKTLSQPVLSILGTSSKQGKFTLQLKLREILKENGYSVGQFGTEPSSVLFGFDYEYPMGFNAADSLNSQQRVALVNHILSEIDDKKPDIIITGSQSNTLPLGTGNLNCFPFYQQDLLYASQPDGCILCVNIFDDLNYIRRTIQYIENFVDTKVFALVISPLNNDFRWSVYGSGEISEIKNLKISSYKKNFMNKINLPVFSFNDKDISELYNLVIKYYSEI